MKIFVTGGTGFIGSHVIKYLANTNYQIIALRRPGSKFRIRSVNSPSWIEKEINEINISDLKGIDSIIHLATAGVSPQKASWEELTEVNVNFGIKLIELAKNAGVRRFITSGTCMEYGNEHNYERIPPNASLNPNNPYAASKAAGFQILNAFAREENIELFYGRIFTAFGEGQFKKNLWPSLKNAAYKGIDFEIN